MDVHALTGPAHECLVPREPWSGVRPEQRAQKPLWSYDEAFEAVDALEEAGAAVVFGDILAVSGAGVTPVPWEPWLPGTYDPDDPPSTRWWSCRRAPEEPWGAFVTRAAAHARTRARELVGSARATPAGTIHVDLAWVTRDELTLFDQPGWERQARRRVVEHGGDGRAWWRDRWARVWSAGRPAPGSYYGMFATDLDEVPTDARYARLHARAGNAPRMAELASLKVLWVEAGTGQTLSRIGRLASLRELALVGDTRLSSLEPLAGLAGLELALIRTGRRLTDPGPLARLPALRYLRLHAAGLQDLSGMSALTQLNSLHLPLGRAVDSLSPLGGLGKLRYLSVWTGRVRDGSAAPLAELRDLRSLAITPNALPLRELARLAAALPDTEGPHRSPFLPRGDRAYDDERCKRCGRPDVHITLGRPRRVLCPGCQAGTIRRHAIRWEILLSAATAERRGASLPG